MVWQGLLDRLKERKHRFMRKQTAKLDAQTQQNLREFLEDVPDEQTETQAIQREIDEAHDKLQQLQEKEAFVGKRLASYKTRLRSTRQVMQGEEDEQPHPDDQVEHEKGNESTKNCDKEAGNPQKTANPKTISQEQDKAYRKHSEVLEQIEANHKTMLRGIEILMEKITLLEERQLELRQKTEECAVVYDATAEGSLPENGDMATEDENNVAADIPIGGEEGVSDGGNGLEKPGSKTSKIATKV